MIARRSLLILLANTLGGLLGYVGVLAIARLLPSPAETLGIVGFGVGFVGSFFILAGLGVQAAHVKRISQGEPLDLCLGAFALIKVVQIGLAVATTFLALFVWSEVLGRGFETALHLRVVYIMILYFVAISVADYGTSTFNARLQTAKTQTAALTGTVVRVAGMIVVAVAGLGPLEIAWAYVAGALALAGGALFFLRRYPLGPPRLGRVKSYMKFALPLAVPAALTSLSVYIDKAVIQLFWGVAEVGYYFTTQLIFRLLASIAAAVSLLLFPVLSRHHARDEIDELRSRSRQAERYLSMILAPASAFLILYPEGVIHVLLADDFLPAVNVLRLFGAAAFVFGLGVPRGTILQGMDRADLAGFVSLLAALVILALYFVLIPTSIFGVGLAGLGAQGAAASVLVGYSVALGIALFFSHRLVGDRVHRPVVFHVAAAASIAIIFTLVLSPEQALNWRWFHLLAVGAAFLGAYIAVLTVAREFRRSDVLFFLDILNPRKMALYIRDELTDTESKESRRSR